MTEIFTPSLRYKFILIFGIFTVLCLGYFIYSFIKLGNSRTEKERKLAIDGIFWSSIASSCCGACFILLGFSYIVL